MATATTRKQPSSRLGGRRAIRPAPIRTGSTCPRPSVRGAVHHPDLRVVLLQPDPLDAVRLPLHRAGQLPHLLQRAGTGKGLQHTLIYAVVTSGAKVVLGMLLAVLLTSQITGRTFLRSVVFFPVLVSFIGVGLTFTALMDPEGLINDALGVIGITGPDWLGDPKWALLSVAFVDIWKGVGLATVIYIAGIVSIPHEYFEAAKMDGATAFDRFRHIILPLARPATVTVILLSLIGGLRSFDLIWAMTGGGPGFTSRRHRLGDLQAVPGRLLRPVDRRQRRAVPAGHPHRAARCSGSSTARRSSCEVAQEPAAGTVSIVAFAIVFLVPVRVHRLDRGQERAAVRVVWTSPGPTPSSSCRTSRTPSRRVTTSWSSRSSTAPS